MNTYEYQNKSTGHGMDRYGACERCGKHCALTYKQQFRKVGQVGLSWSVAGFGHVECLRTGNWKDAPVSTGESS